jgi:hypothetical protein
MPGCVILTDRRVVMLVARRSPVWRWFLGPILARLAEEAAPLELTHQIDRDDFAAVEQEPHRSMISFHSKGEGYGHISFVVYSQTPFVVWQQRMHHWAAGALSTAPIPTGKLVDR